MDLWADLNWVDGVEAQDVRCHYPGSFVVADSFSNMQLVKTRAMKCVPEQSRSDSKFGVSWICLSRGR